MAGKAFPPSRRKREILNGHGTPPERLVELGETAEAEGFPNDALDFFEKAGDVEGLERVRARAVEEGDLFLLARSAKALGTTPSREELTSLARRADELGKLAFAVEAWRRAGEESEAVRLLTPPPSSSPLDSPPERA